MEWRKGWKKRNRERERRKNKKKVAPDTVTNWHVLVYQVSILKRTEVNILWEISSFLFPLSSILLKRKREKKRKKFHNFYCYYPRKIVFINFKEKKKSNKMNEKIILSEYLVVLPLKKVFFFLFLETSKLRETEIENEVGSERRVSERKKRGRLRKIFEETKFVKN